MGISPAPFPRTPAIARMMTLLAIGAHSSAEIGATCMLLAVAVPFAFAMIILVAAWRRAAGTTLVAPITWCAISLISVQGALVVMLNTDFLAADRSGFWWLVGATSTLCPLVALLGSKRPQDGAWNAIVICFWIVAAWPSIQSLGINLGEPVPDLWRFLYAAVLLVGLVNYWPTFFRTAAIMAVCGQSLILWSFLPGTHALDGAEALIGVGLISGAIIWASLLWRWRRVRRAARNTAWDRLWLDLRDDFGLAWGVRVMERINALAKSTGARIALDWDGFLPSEQAGAIDETSAMRSAGFSLRRLLRSTAAGAPPEAPPLTRAIPASVQMAKLEPGIRNILRRFVSDAWIDARIGAGPTEQANSTVSSPAGAP